MNKVEQGSDQEKLLKPFKIFKLHVFYLTVAHSLISPRQLYSPTFQILHIPYNIQAHLPGECGPAKFWLFISSWGDLLILMVSLIWPHFCSSTLLTPSGKHSSLFSLYCIYCHLLTEDWTCNHCQGIKIKDTFERIWVDMLTASWHAFVLWRLQQ